MSDPPDSPETVGDLIALLERYDFASPVRLAIQPGWPYEATIGQVMAEDGCVWIAVGEQHGYLAQALQIALDWPQPRAI